MTLSESLLPEFDREMATTRRVLERVPEDRLTWRPHRQEHDARRAVASIWAQLGHVGLEPTITESGVDLEQMTRPAGWRRPARARRCSSTFDATWRRPAAALVGRTDAELMAPWTLRRGRAGTSSRCPRPPAAHVRA